MVQTMETKDQALSLRVDAQLRARLQTVADRSYRGAISKAGRAMLETGINAVETQTSPVRYAGSSPDIQSLADRWDALPESVRASIRNLAGI